MPTPTEALVVQFRILGPLEVTAAGRPLALGGPRQRALLAALLLRANQVTTTDWLIDQLWGAAPPRTARASLHNHVRRLRQALPPGTVLTRPSGYLLRVDPDQVDALCFERLVADGRSHVEADPERAAAHLAEALALWRGPALAGVDADALRQVAVPRLHDLRIAALEQRIDADLRLGRHAAVAGELRELVAEHPLHERFHEQLMLALYRCGRQAEALDSYRRVRQCLVDQLGIEPGPALQQLQRDVLAAAPRLRPGTEPAGDTPAAVPRQLPAGTATFTGRERELGRLEALLNREGIPVVAIDGPAGIGKSALALRAAHRLTGAFGGGQLYADLQGATPGATPLAPAAVLGRFLRALGVAGRDVPAEPAEAAGLLRSLVAGQRVLFVLDNATDAAQVGPLLPGTPGPAVLVTSRRRLADLDGATCLALGALPDQAAARLLGDLVGSERAAAAPEAASEIIRVCGGLPLAVRIAGARLAARPEWPLAVLAERLAGQRRRLDELRSGGLAVRASLHVSYRGLPPRDRCLFRLLGLLPGRDLGAGVAAALLDRPVSAATAALERLLDARLLDSPEAARYQLHDLVRLFARERAAREDQAGGRDAALARALRWYLATAASAIARLRPGGLTGGPPVPGSGAAFRDAAAALDWLERERANLLAAVELSARAGAAAPEVAVRLPPLLAPFLELRGYFTDWEQASRLALRAARRAGDRHGEAMAARSLGTACLSLRRPSDAARLLAEAQAGYRAAGDAAGEAGALNNVGIAHFQSGDLAAAAACYQQATTILGRLGNRVGEAVGLANLARCHADSGRHAEALDCHRRSLAVFRDLGERRLEADAIGNLGLIYAAMGRAGRAVACHQQAAAIFAELGDLHKLAATYGELADAHQLGGHPSEAAAAAERRLDLAREAGDAHAEAEALCQIDSLRARDTGGAAES